MDASLRTSTNVVLALLAANCVLLLGLAARPDAPNGVRIFLVVGAIALAVPVPLAYAYAPKVVRLKGSEVVIERRAGTSIRYSASNAELIPSERLQGSLRTFGVGGLFANFGRFRNRTLGSYRKYATRSSGYVLLTTDRGPVVVTPANPDAFVRAWGGGDDP